MKVERVAGQASVVAHRFMPPILIGRNSGVEVGRRERACAPIPWLLPWYLAFRAFICRFALADRDFTYFCFTLFLKGKMIDIAITHAAAAKLVLTSGFHFAVASAAGNSFDCIFLLARGVIKRTKCYYRKIWGKYQKQLNWKWKGQGHCAELLPRTCCCSGHAWCPRQWTS